MLTLLDRIEAFLGRNPEVSPTGLGQSAMNDSALVSSLRTPQRGHKRPRQPQESTIRRVDAWMQDYDAQKRRRAAAERRKAAAEARRAARQG